MTDGVNEPRNRLLVTLCTYNESENLPKLVPEMHQVAPDADILIIDDASPDGTGELADQMAAADERIKVLHRQGKLGLGTANVASYRYAIEHDYDLLLNMDADFSHHPRHIPAIRECLHRADVGIGSRYVPGGEIVGWNLKRHLMSRCINLYARLLLGLPSRDSSGSFRCYRVSELAKLDFDQVRSRGYSFQEEILYMCRRIGCRFEETPITFEERRSGHSKMSSDIVREAIRVVWKLWFSSGMRRKPTGGIHPKSVKAKAQTTTGAE